MSSEKIILDLLKHLDLDAILISSPHHIRYLTTYFGFSVDERDALILFTKNQKFIITNPLHSLAVKKNVKEFILLETNSLIPYFTHLRKVIKENKINSLGIEDDNLTVKEFISIQKICNDLVPVSLQDLRIHKSPLEINAIKKACEIGDNALVKLQSQIELGMSERIIARKLELIIKELDADLSFPTIVAFGENAAVPHHMTDETILKKDDLILIDFGVQVHNYCSDMTRTFFMNSASDEMKKAYEVVYTSQQLAEEFIKDNLKNDKSIQAASVDKVARDYIISKGFPSIPHSLGHGIGLEVHEAPSLSPKSDYNITDGMVFSIEPGIYLENSFGIRIEDLYTIQNNKLIQLTESPIELLS